MSTYPFDFTPLRSYLSQLASFDESDWYCLEEIASIKQFHKKEYIQKAGRPCRMVGFILGGCVRWVKDLNGIERTFDFAIANDFVTDYVSIITGKPGEVNIVAIKDTTMICMDAARLLALFNRSFAWQKAGRHLAERTACYAMERLLASYYETPQMRYERLMASSPELFLQIPHHILANYLGITKETLSRLRNTNR